LLHDSGRSSVARTFSGGWTPHCIFSPSIYKGSLDRLRSSFYRLATWPLRGLKSYLLSSCYNLFCNWCPPTDGTCVRRCWRPVAPVRGVCFFSSPRYRIVYLRPPTCRTNYFPWSGQWYRDQWFRQSLRHPKFAIKQKKTKR